MFFSVVLFAVITNAAIASAGQFQGLLWADTVCVRTLGLCHEPFLLGLATGLIVHSEYVERRAREAGYAGPIDRIPHPAWSLPPVEPARIEGAPLYGCFGNLNESKRIQELLAGFARARARVPSARLLLVGDASRRLRALDPPDGVIRRERVPEDELWSLMSACDAIVSLRSPTMGETSGSAIRALSLGRPLVVSDVGWFAELPDDAAVKVPIGAGEVETIAAALEVLADPELRARMSRSARDLVETEHALDRVADAYAAALTVSQAVAA